MTSFKRDGSRAIQLISKLYERAPAFSPLRPHSLSKGQALVQKKHARIRTVLTPPFWGLKGSEWISLFLTGLKCAKSVRSTTLVRTVVISCAHKEPSLFRQRSLWLIAPSKAESSSKLKGIRAEAHGRNLWRTFGSLTEKINRVFHPIKKRRPLFRH